MNQKIYLIIGILVAISVTSACLGAAPAESSEAEAEAPILEALLPSQGSAPEVSVVTVETGTVEQTRNWVATMQPLDQYPVQAPMAGVITRQAVRVGDEVQQGDFLVRLDIPGTRGRQAALTQRRDTLQTDVQRWERLIDRGAAGPAELEAARLRLLDAEEALAELDATLGARRLTAPVAGIVSQSSFTEGAHVVAGQPLLTITDRASMGLRLTVPTADAAHFREPDALQIRNRTRLTGRASTVLSPSRVIFQEGPRPGYITVELRVDDLDDPTPVDVEIIAERTRDVLLVPWTAIAADDDQSWVGIVTGTPPRVERRSVVHGDAFSDGVEIVEGLSPGEKVLRHEPRSRREGSEVRLVEIR